LEALSTDFGYQWLAVLQSHWGLEAAIFLFERLQHQAAGQIANLTVTGMQQLQQQEARIVALVARVWA